MNDGEKERRENEIASVYSFFVCANKMVYT